MNLTNQLNSICARHPRCHLALLMAISAISSAATIGNSLAIEPPPDGGYPNRVTALGEDALFTATTGTDDTAIGYEALYSSNGGLGSNTAVGSMALHNNTTGYANVAVGYQPLYDNTTGTFNEAIGENALIANTTGSLNVAIGKEALQAHATPFDNVAIGSGAMSLGTQGEYNVAIGDTAMAFSNGTDNVAVGAGAMNAANGSSNVAIGSFAGLNFAGNSNIAIGIYAGQNVTNGANNIEIGNQGTSRDSEIIRLGTVGTQKKTFIAGISGTTVSNGVAVIVNTKGQLGIATSSARYKEAIQPMKDASEAVLSLKPVTFRYKKELDPEAIPQFGLVAEDVAKVDPDLVAKDEEGKPYTVRYEAVNAMLLNEFLKAHHAIVNQQQEIEERKLALKEQATQIERIGAQMAVTKPAPPVADNR